MLPTKKWNEIFTVLKCNPPMSRSDESISLINCTLEFMDGKFYRVGFCPSKTGFGQGSGQNLVLTG